MTYTDHDLVVIVPMLGRSHHIDPMLQSVRSTTPNARVLFMCSPRDFSVIDELEKLGEDHREIGYYPVGDYARKINVGVEETKEPLIFLAASDLRFHPDWFEHAIRKLSPGIGVVGTNDLGNERVMSGEHSTHSLVTREYARMGVIDNPRHLLFEGYPHEFVDDEFVETAKRRNAFVSAVDSIVEHMHPNWGKGDMDSLYGQQRQRMALGRRIYMTRRRKWA